MGFRGLVDRLGTGLLLLGLAIFICALLGACGTDNKVGGRIEIDSTTHTIKIENPVIEFCERRYPKLLYPDKIEQETLITECLDLCSETGGCTVDLPDSLPENI